MSRQVNLLVRERGAPALSAQRALIGLGAILVAFLGYGAYASIQSARSNDTMAQNNAQLVAEKAALQALEQKLAGRPKPADLAAQIEALRAQAIEGQEILKLLKSGEGTSSEGYLGHLATLARVSEEGLWLTNIRIDASGKNINLVGHALRHESVLRYAQRLNEQFAAYGVRFTGLELIPEAGKVGASATPSSSVAFRLFSPV